MEDATTYTPPHVFSGYPKPQTVALYKDGTRRIVVNVEDKDCYREDGWLEAGESPSPEPLRPSAEDAGLSEESPLAVLRAARENLSRTPKSALVDALTELNQEPDAGKTKAELLSDLDELIGDRLDEE